MVYLILKDILLQKKRLLYFPIMYSIFAILVLQEFFSPFLIASIVIPYLLLQTAVVYEDMNKTEIVLNSLPIKKEKVIMARYLSIFVYLVISIFLYIIISFLIGIINSPFNAETVTISGIVIAIMSLGILTSTYLPVYYKYGYIKAKLFHVSFVMAAFFLPTFIVEIFNNNPDAAFVRSVNTFVQSISKGGLNFILLVLTCLIMTISFFLSVCFYKKREF